MLADAHAVFGHAVELPRMSCKAALVAERVGYILDSDVSRIRKQRPEADAGESGDGAVGSHTTQKITPDTLGTIPHPAVPAGEAVKPPPRVTRSVSLGAVAG